MSHGEYYTMIFTKDGSGVWNLHTVAAITFLI
jgi:hypothetical protein